MLPIPLLGRLPQETPHLSREHCLQLPLVRNLYGLTTVVTFSILIINPANKGFNGPFAIAEYVKVSKLSFDVTNVQLVVADGYVRNFASHIRLHLHKIFFYPFQFQIRGVFLPCLE